MAKNRRKYLLGQDIATILDNANENIANIINGGENGTDTVDLGTTNLSTISDAASGAKDAADAAQAAADAAKAAADAAKAVADAAMPKAGGTFTGPIIIKDPTEEKNPATKKYVDDAIKNVHPLAYVVSTNAADTPAGIVWYSGSEESTKITGALAASATTEYIIYLVPCKHTAAEALKGYDEYLTVKKDSAYSWEIIGNSVDIDLSNVGKVKDVKVNGTSVLGTDGVAAITIADLEADFVSVTTTDSAWTTKTVNGTDYKAIKVEKTDTALGVFNSSGQEMVIQKVYDNNYLYLCVGTVKIACTIRKLSGGAVGTGGSGDVTAAGDNIFTGYNSFRHRVAVDNGSNNIACLDYNCITRSVDTSNYTLTLPTKTGTLAITADIPTVTHKYLHQLNISGQDSGREIKFAMCAMYVSNSDTKIETFGQLFSALAAGQMMATGYCGGANTTYPVYCLNQSKNNGNLIIHTVTNRSNASVEIDPGVVSFPYINDTVIEL